MTTALTVVPDAHLEPVERVYPQSGSIMSGLMQRFMALCLALPGKTPLDAYRMGISPGRLCSPPMSVRDDGVVEILIPPPEQALRWAATVLHTPEKVPQHAVQQMKERMAAQADLLALETRTALGQVARKQAQSVLAGEKSPDHAFKYAVDAHLYAEQTSKPASKAPQTQNNFFLKGLTGGSGGKRRTGGQIRTRKTRPTAMIEGEIVSRDA